MIREFWNGFHVEAVSRTFSHYRRTSRRIEPLERILRFEELENGILYARIAPKSDILAFLIPHFADRLPADNFIIYDENRGSIWAASTIS